MSASLRFDILPDLPQSEILGHFARTLWQEDDVLAIWLGGSFGSGRADAYSDVDLRVAVKPEHLVRWDEDYLRRLLPLPALVCETHGREDETVLYHLLLQNCELYDVWLQTPDASLLHEPRLVLGCRHDDLYERLIRPEAEQRMQFEPVDGETLRGAIKSYWLNHVKNQKVVHRDLTLMWRDGLYLFGGLLLRLRFALATGKDSGPITFPPMTIHRMTPIAQILRDEYGDHALDGLQAAGSDRSDTIASIDSLSAKISLLGREAARRFDFEYPEALEARVLRSWERFKQEQTR